MSDDGVWEKKIERAEALLSTLPPNRAFIWEGKVYTRELLLRMVEIWKRRIEWHKMRN